MASPIYPPLVRQTLFKLFVDHAYSEGEYEDLKYVYDWMPSRIFWKTVLSDDRVIVTNAIEWFKRQLIGAYNDGNENFWYRETVAFSVSAVNFLAVENSVDSVNYLLNYFYDSEQDAWYEAPGSVQNLSGQLLIESGRLALEGTLFQNLCSAVEHSALKTVATYASYSRWINGILKGPSYCFDIGTANHITPEFAIQLMAAMSRVCWRAACLSNVRAANGLCESLLTRSPPFGKIEFDDGKKVTVRKYLRHLDKNSAITPDSTELLALEALNKLACATPSSGELANTRRIPIKIYTGRYYYLVISLSQRSPIAAAATKTASLSSIKIYQSALIYLSLLGEVITDSSAFNEVRNAWPKLSQDPTPKISVALAREKYTSYAGKSLQLNSGEKSVLGTLPVYRRLNKSLSHISAAKDVIADFYRRDNLEKNHHETTRLLEESLIWMCQWVPGIRECGSPAKFFAESDTTRERINWRAATSTAIRRCPYRSSENSENPTK